MSYLAEPARSDEADTLYDADRASLGYVANYSKVFAHRPRVYRAWKELNGAVKATMDPVCDTTGSDLRISSLSVAQCLYV